MTDTVDASAVGCDVMGKAEGVVLPGVMAMLAGQEKTWSPALLPGLFWRALTNLGTIREVHRSIKVGPLSETAENNPRFSFKFLSHNYLARSLTVGERASCFLHHHRRMEAVLPAGMLREILLADVRVHEIVEADHRFTLTIGLTRQRNCDKEGEWSINLLVDGEIVYVLSFTVIPGWTIGTTADEVVLISRLQGMPGRYSEIKLATRAMVDVAPGALLLAAVQGLAVTLAIGELASVSATDQSMYCKEYEAVFKSAYDEFFAELGIAKNGAGFFLSPIPIPEKPMSLVKQGHKLRTRAKRAFKAEIMLEVAEFFRKGIACADADAARGHFSGGELISRWPAKADQLAATDEVIETPRCG